MNELNSEATDFFAHLSLVEYIEKYRDVPRFESLCRQCPNYNKLWSCPPFECDSLLPFQAYENITILATKIVPRDANLPLSLAADLLLPERKRLERLLLEAEVAIGGRSFAFAGKCLHCPDGECTRPRQHPCRHPELVRPSLEACGFNLGATLHDLFNFDIKWSSDERMPEYLTLITAIAHNCEPAIATSFLKKS